MNKAGTIYTNTGIQKTKSTILKNVYGNISTSLLTFFMLWPFASFVYALRNFKKSWAATIFLLFAAFFGFTLVQGGDTFRITESLRIMHKDNLSLNGVIGIYFQTGSDILDIVYTLIIWLVSIFTDDSRFLFAILAFILAFFIIKTFRFVISESTLRYTALEGLLLIAIVLTVQVWYLAGRWNLAAIVYAYGTIRYFYKKDRKYLYLALISIFIHWTFIFMAPLIFVFMITKNRTRIYYAIFTISFFFSLVNPYQSKELFDRFAPRPIEQSRGGYLSEENIEMELENRSAGNFYLQGHTNALNWMIFILVTYIMINKINVIKREKCLFKLFNYSLFFQSVSYLLSPLPNMYRFNTIGQLYFLAFFFISINKLKIKIEPVLRILSGAILVFFIIVRIRIGFDFISIWTIIGNPIYVYLVKNDYGLIKYVKDIINI